ncbi:MAG: phage integrase N-terminal SAM-like domain-containing protein, partial [Actinobacteria bacterium]|nr:phage integrase N-terminal SAM-like domain-containing protein [Actinomycetota bacterium]
MGLFMERSSPRLYDSVVGVLRARHYSPRTVKAYTYWIGRYLRHFHGVHPRALAEPNVNEFLTRLAVDEDVAAATQNQALCALLFLYEHVLEQ